MPEGYLLIGFVFIGIYLAIGASQLIIYFTTERSYKYLLLAGISVVASAYLYYSLQVRSVGDLNHVLSSYKWSVTLYLIEFALLTALVQTYLKKSFRPAFYAVLAVLSFTLVLNLIIPNGVIYKELSSLEPINSGSSYFYASGEVNWFYELLSIAFYVAFLAYFVMAMIWAAKDGTKVNLLTFSGFLIIFLGTNVYDVLIDLGYLRAVYITEYSILPILLLFGFDLVIQLKEKNKVKAELEVANPHEFQLITTKLASRGSMQKLFEPSPSCDDLAERLTATVESCAGEVTSFGVSDVDTAVGFLLDQATTVGMD